MKKVLIIPDVHNQWERVNRIIEREYDATQIVCLGDWFDSVGANTSHNERTAIYLKSLLSDERFIPIFGNHDLHYFSTSRRVISSGYDAITDMAINAILNSGDWSKFRFYHIMDCWILSHAGITNAFASKIDNLQEEDDKARQALSRNEPHWFYQVGNARGGNHEYGGLLWCDFFEEFIGIHDRVQIFGHTPYTSPRWVGSNETHIPLHCLSLRTTVYNYPFDSNPFYNLCLDTHLHHYAIWDGQRLKIVELDQDLLYG